MKTLLCLVLLLIATCLSDHTRYVLRVRHLPQQVQQAQLETTLRTTLALYLKNSPDQDRRRAFLGELRDSLEQPPLKKVMRLRHPVDYHKH